MSKGAEQESGVILTQEVAKIGDGQLPPDQYVLSEEERPKGDAPLASNVPVIDLSRLLVSDDEAEKLRSALQSLGIFQVIGHDLSPDLLDELRDVAKEFFILPAEEKQKYSNCVDGMVGFEGYGTDMIAEKDQTLDWLDRLLLTIQPEEQRNLRFWPENPESFRKLMNEYAMKVKKLGEDVSVAMSKLLKLEQNYFINTLLDKAEVYARFNYYPSCSRPDLVLGARPHTDGCALTILLPDKEVEGLQVLEDGVWMTVPIIPHAIIINMGNQLKIMTNGIFKSPMHRVVTGSKERISVAMFYSLHPEMTLEPAAELIDETRPSLYEKMNALEYKMTFLSKLAKRQVEN